MSVFYNLCAAKATEVSNQMPSGDLFSPLTAIAIMIVYAPLMGVMKLPRGGGMGIYNSLAEGFCAGQREPREHIQVNGKKVP